MTPGGTEPSRFGSYPSTSQHVQCHTFTQATFPPFLSSSNKLLPASPAPHSATLPLAAGVVVFKTPRHMTLVLETFLWLSGAFSIESMLLSLPSRSLTSRALGPSFTTPPNPASILLWVTLDLLLTQKAPHPFREGSFLSFTSQVKCHLLERPSPD